MINTGFILIDSLLASSLQMSYDISLPLNTVKFPMIRFHRSVFLDIARPPRLEAAASFRVNCHRRVATRELPLHTFR